MGNEDLIQIAERQLADAEAVYRLDPSEANQRRIMRAWSAVREARGDGQDKPAAAKPSALPDE